ncbi:MAG: preprotein translocase subunit SecG [Calditrichaeota bacterium]|nr:preprotein translocase subunit SecG [Calditrichota bacterium]
MIVVKVILISIHVLVSLVLIVAILLQSSKGGGLAATFGGQTTALFGPRSAASALSTITKYLAVVFLILSFILSLLAAGGSQNISVTQRVMEQSPLPAVEDLNLGGETTPAPALPGQEGAPVDLMEGSGNP